MSIATPRGRLVSLAFLAAASVGVAGIFAWCSRTPPEVLANEALVAAVPLYPGAVEIDRDHTPYNFADGVSSISPAAGWNTRVTYRVPMGTTAEDLYAFYDGALDASWERRVEVTPVMEISGATPPAPGSSATATRPLAPVLVGEVRHLSFCRDGARLALSTDNMPGEGTFDLGVDASWAEPGIRGC